MSALRVLLIGNDTAETQHINSVLSEAQHAVVPVPSFDEASEALMIQKFDAVLIGPALSGDGVSTFTTKLRQGEAAQRNAVRTPVLSVLTGNVNTSGSNGSVDAYLPGHFESAQFAETVENLAQVLSQSGKQPDGPSEQPDLPVFDVAAFEAQVAYDSELMVEIIDLFLAEREQDLIEMTEALESGDLGKLMRSAHTIKGSLGSVHASLARTRSQELESAAKNGNRQACESLLGALKQDLSDLEPQLLSLRNSAQSSK